MSLCTTQKHSEHEGGGLGSGLSTSRACMPSRTLSQRPSARLARSLSRRMVELDGYVGQFHLLSRAALTRAAS